MPPALAKLLASAPPGDSISRWFTRIAEALLTETVLDVAGEAHELCEIEFYLHGEGHRDPFTHNDELQRSSGRWYFHRIGESYRGGTYKGLDLTFGPADTYGGILLRSLRTPTAALINGSSLCVDHMLARTGHTEVAALAAAAAGPDSPLRLRAADKRALELYFTARVGLSLKRVAEHPAMPAYIVRPYRALTRARAIKKGRVHLIVARHQAGDKPEQIAALTGTPKRTIAEYVAAYERGRTLGSTSSLHGRSLGAIDLCLLHGALADRAASSDE